MRDRDIIDAELRLLAAVRWLIREQDGQPGSLQVDKSLDERAESESYCGWRLPYASCLSSSSLRLC